MNFFFSVEPNYRTIFKLSLGVVPKYSMKRTDFTNTYVFLCVEHEYEHKKWRKWYFQGQTYKKPDFLTVFRDNYKYQL